MSPVFIWNFFFEIFCHRGKTLPFGIKPAALEGRPRGGSITGLENISQYIYLIGLTFGSGNFP
jgi:hypothetical protein